MIEGILRYAGLPDLEVELERGMGKYFSGDTGLIVPEPGKKEVIRISLGDEDKHIYHARDSHGRKHEHKWRPIHSDRADNKWDDGNCRWIETSPPPQKVSWMRAATQGPGALEQHRTVRHAFKLVRDSGR